MLLVTSLLRWWYTDGLRQQFGVIGDKLAGTADFFSFGLLFKTLFTPFRQISAGKVDGSLELQFRALIDKLFSRFIGAFIRLVIIFVGILIISLQLLVSIIIFFAWLLVPFAPAIGVVLSATGVHP